MRAAQIHAEQMARAEQMAHDLPGAAYPHSEDRLAAAKYRWTAYGENVAMGQSSAAHALDSWMHSPGHRKNILNPVYTELGVGYAVDGRAAPTSCRSSQGHPLKTVSVATFLFAPRFTFGPGFGP